MRYLKSTIPIFTIFAFFTLSLFAGCRPTTPNVAVPQEFVAAADVLEKSVAETPQQYGVAAEKVTDLKGNIAEYRSAVSGGVWTDKVIPTLRVAYDMYEALRASGVGLPRLPDFIVDLIKCPAPPRPKPDIDASTVKS